jgi:prepilin-type N-terminal cleavage/methylation domain-containing protein
MSPRRLAGTEAGFSLLEVLVATALLATALATLGQAFGLSVAENSSARYGTFAAVLAGQKIEQLRSLAWGFDASGLSFADLTSNTALRVPAPTGGTGLTPSPADSLTRNVAGYVDYLDGFGTSLGGGGSVPPRTVYIRRWSIEPLPASPATTLILQVLVTRWRDRGAADQAGSVSRLRDEARLATAKTRKAP